jgi:CheY-like chemotaxis protein/AraC-like DNA-binding protein
MDFRKLEANSMELHISKGNIVKFIESIYGNFNSLANNYNISLDFYSNFPGNDSWFDADKIEKIVYNLVSNAVKFTPEFGKVKLSLIKEDDDQNHGKIFIIVEDTGIGIPDEEKEKIFEPFFQGRTVPLRKHEGTGIGLSLVKNLVELHHGKLHVKSAFKKQKSGKHDFTTSFSVEIPLNEENYVPSEIELREIDLPDIEIDEIFESEQIESSDNNERPSGLPLVLLVEDNEDLSQLVKDSFKGIYHVEWAKNGEEGYNKTIEILPNIIISDIMMPVLNGIEMCKKIKNNSSISHIPIILLTAKNTDDSQIEGYKAGADDYISKPFSIPILIARVKNLIESRDILRKKFRNELEINTIGKIVPIKEKDFMQKVLDIIEQNISNSDFDVESLSREVGVSSRHLLNKIQSLTDYTPVEFIRTIRLKKAEQLLLNTKLTISEVAYDVGFADPNYFGKCFQKHFGKSPKEFLASKIHS